MDGHRCHSSGRQNILFYVLLAGEVAYLVKSTVQYVVTD